MNMVVYTLEQRWGNITTLLLPILANKKLSFQMKLCRIQGTKNPHAFACIIGSFFFANEQGEAVTVNDDRYRAMFNEFFLTKIDEEDIGNIWFQQNGATCHTVDVLRPVFENRIISFRADVVWSSQSCDLTLRWIIVIRPW